MESQTSKKRTTNERILSYLNKKGAANWDEKTVKEVLCSLCTKNLLNSNDIAESEENEIPNLLTADVIHIKPVELEKDVQRCNLNSQQASQGIISNPLTPARIGSPPPFSIYTPTSARIINTEKGPLCSPLPINLVTSQLTQLENKLCGKIMATKSYFIYELHSIHAEIVNCKNKTKNPTSVDVKVSELQSKTGILEAENKMLKESCSNKQKLLEVIFEYHTVLIKEKSEHVVNPNDKQVILNKSTCDSQNHMGLDKSNGKKSEHTKTINNVRNNSENLQADRKNNGAKANEDSVIIVGDSMIKHLNCRDIYRSHTIKVRPFPGASTHI